MDEVIELARKYERLRAAADAVLCDLRASEKMAGKIIHLENCGSHCKCKPEPKAPAWHSFKVLGAELHG